MSPHMPIYEGDRIRASCLSHDGGSKTEVNTKKIPKPKVSSLHAAIHNEIPTVKYCTNHVML